MIREPRARSFLARYLMLFGGETFSKLCVMTAFVYLARVLPPSDYGIVELALSVTVFFVLGVESGMGLYGARVVAGAPERTPELVPQVMLLRVLLAAPAFAGILAVATYFQSSGLGILAVNGIAVLFTPLLTQWVFQGLRQMQWVAMGTAARNFVFVAMVLLLVRPGSDIRLVALAEVTGIATLAAFNTFLLHRRLRVRLQWRGVLAGTRRLFHDVWYMGLSDFTWACQWYSPAIVMSWIGSGTEHVAWVASAVRVVMALHTFVWLYFFNLLPGLAKELTVGLHGWRSMVTKSMATSLWPAALIAVGGTLIAPLLVPAVYGQPYVAAVRPFQIVIWMIPVAWFSGHFRFSLIAAGQQRWEFAVSAATAVVTVTSSAVLGYYSGATGAAAALLTGGTVNAVLAVLASHRYIGPVPFVATTGPVVGATALSLMVGYGVTQPAGPLAGTTAACLTLTLFAVRQQGDLVQSIRTQLLSRR